MAMASRVKSKGCAIVPARCELCTIAIDTAFVHGTTYHGVTRGMPGPRWADMCLPCHGRHGTGLGPDDGQQYELQVGKLSPHIPIGWKKVRG